MFIYFFEEHFSDCTDAHILYFDCLKQSALVILITENVLYLQDLHAEVLPRCYKEIQNDIMIT